VAVAREEAIALAVKAGARADTVEIVDIEEVPLPYQSGSTNRVKVKTGQGCLVKPEQGGAGQD